MADFFPEVTNLDLVAAYRGMPEIHAEMERLVPRFEVRLAEGDSVLLDVAKRLRVQALFARAQLPAGGRVRGTERFASKPPEWVGREDEKVPRGKDGYFTDVTDAELLGAYQQARENGLFDRLGSVGKFALRYLEFEIKRKVPVRADVLVTLRDFALIIRAAKEGGVDLAQILAETKAQAVAAVAEAKGGAGDSIWSGWTATLKAGVRGLGRLLSLTPPSPLPSPVGGEEISKEDAAFLAHLFERLERASEVLSFSAQLADQYFDERMRDPGDNVRALSVPIDGRNMEILIMKEIFGATVVRRDGRGQLSMAFVSLHAEREKAGKLFNRSFAPADLSEIVARLPFRPLVPHPKDPRYAVVTTPQLGTVAVLLALKNGQLELGFLPNQSNPELAAIMGPKWTVVPIERRQDDYVLTSSDRAFLDKAFAFVEDQPAFVGFGPDWAERWFQDEWKNPREGGHHFEVELDGRTVQLVVMQNSYNLTVIRRDAPKVFQIVPVSKLRDPRRTDILGNPKASKANVIRAIRDLPFRPVENYGKPKRWIVRTPHVGPIILLLMREGEHFYLTLSPNDKNPLFAVHLSEGPEPVEFYPALPPPHLFSADKHEIYHLKNPTLVGNVLHRLGPGPRVASHWFFDFSGIMVSFTYTNDDLHLYTWDIVKPEAATAIRRLFARRDDRNFIDDATTEEIMRLFVHNIILKLRQGEGELYARTADNVNFELPAKKGQKIADIFGRAELRFLDDRKLLDDLGYDGRVQLVTGVLPPHPSPLPPGERGTGFPLLDFSYSGPSRFKPDIYRIKSGGKADFSGNTGHDMSGAFTQTFYDFDGIFVQVMTVQGQPTRIFIAKPGRADEIRRRLVEMKKVPRGGDGKPLFTAEQSAELKRFFDDTFYPVNRTNPQTPLEKYFAQRLSLLETKGERNEVFLEVKHEEGEFLLERLGYQPQAEEEPVIQLSKPRVLAHRAMTMVSEPAGDHEDPKVDYEIWILDFSGVPVAFIVPDRRPEMGIAAILRAEEIPAILEHLAGEVGETTSPETTQQVTTFIMERAHRMIRHVPRSPHHPAILEEKDLVLDLGEETAGHGEPVEPRSVAPEKVSLNINTLDIDELKRFGLDPSSSLSLHVRPGPKIRLVTLVNPDRPREVIMTYAIYNFNGIHVAHSVGNEDHYERLRRDARLAMFPDLALTVVLDPARLREIRSIIGDDDVTLRDRRQQERFMRTIEAARKQVIPHTGADLAKFKDQRILLEVDSSQKDLVPRIMTAQLRIEAVPFSELVSLGLGGIQTMRAPSSFSRAWFQQQTTDDPGVFYYLAPDGTWEKGVLLKTDLTADRNFFGVVIRHQATHELSLLYWFTNKDDVLASLKNEVLKALAGNKRIFNPAVGEALQNSRHLTSIDGIGEKGEHTGPAGTMSVEKGRLVIRSELMAGPDKRLEFFPHPRPPRPLRAENHPAFSADWFDSLDFSDLGVFFLKDRKCLFLESSDGEISAFLIRNGDHLDFVLIDRAAYDGEKARLLVNQFLIKVREALSGNRVTPDWDAGLITTAAGRFLNVSPADFEKTGERGIHLFPVPIVKDGLDLPKHGRLMVSGRHLVSADPDCGVHVFSVPEKPAPFTHAWFEAIPDSNPNVYYLRSPAGAGSHLTEEGWKKYVVMSPVGEPKSLVLLSLSEGGDMTLCHLFSTQWMELGLSLISELKEAAKSGNRMIADRSVWEGLKVMPHQPLARLIREGTVRVEGETLSIRAHGGPPDQNWGRLYLSRQPVLPKDSETREPFSSPWFMVRPVSDPGVFFIGEKKFVLLESGHPMGGVLLVTADPETGCLGFTMINSLTPTLGSNILEVVKETQKPGASRFLPKPYEKWFMDAGGERVIVLSTVAGGQPFPHGFWQLPKMGDSIRYAKGTWTLTPEGIVYASDDGREREAYRLPVGYPLLRKEGLGEVDRGVSSGSTPSGSPLQRGRFLSAEWFFEYVRNRTNPGVFFNGIQPFVYLKIRGEKDLILMTVNDEGTLMHTTLNHTSKMKVMDHSALIKNIESSVRQGRREIGGVPQWRFGPMKDVGEGMHVQDVALFQEGDLLTAIQMMPLFHGQQILGQLGIDYHLQVRDDRLVIVAYREGKLLAVKEALLPEESLPAAPRVAPARERPQETRAPEDSAPPQPPMPTLNLVSAAIDDFHRVRPGVAAIPLTGITGSTNLARFVTVTDEPLPIVMRITGRDDLKTFGEFRRKARPEDKMKIDIRWGSGADELSYEVGGSRDNFLLKPSGKGAPQGDVRLVYNNHKTQLILDPASELYRWLDERLYGPRVTMMLEKTRQGPRLSLRAERSNPDGSTRSPRSQELARDDELLQQMQALWSSLKPVEEVQPDGSRKLIIAFAEAESEKIASLIADTGKIYAQSVGQKRDVVWKYPRADAAVASGSPSPSPPPVEGGGIKGSKPDVVEPFTMDIELPSPLGERVGVRGSGFIRLRGKKTTSGEGELKAFVVEALELDERTNKRDLRIAVGDEAVSFPITELPVKISIFRELVSPSPPASSVALRASGNSAQFALGLPAQVSLLAPPLEGGGSLGWESFDLSLKIQRGKLAGEIKNYSFTSLEESRVPDMVTDPGRLDEWGEIFADPFRITLKIVNHPIEGKLVTEASLKIDPTVAELLDLPESVEMVPQKFPTRLYQPFSLNFNVPGFGYLSYDFSPNSPGIPPTALRTATTVAWGLNTSPSGIVLHGFDEHETEFKIPLDAKGGEQTKRFFIQADERKKFLALLKLQGTPVSFDEATHTHVEILIVDKSVVGFEPVTIVDEAFLPVPILRFSEGVLDDLLHAPSLLAAHSTLPARVSDVTLKDSEVEETLEFERGEALVPTAKTTTLIRQNVDASGERPVFTFTHGSLYQYELRGAVSGITLVFPVRWRADRPSNPWQLDESTPVRYYLQGQNASSAREINDPRFKFHDGGGDWAAYRLGTKHADSAVGPHGETAVMDFCFSAVVSSACPALIGAVNILDENGSDAKKLQYRKEGHMTRDLAVARLLSQWGDDVPTVYSRPKAIGNGRAVRFRFFSEDPSRTEWAELSPFHRDASKKFHRFGDDLTLKIGTGTGQSATVTEEIRVKALQDVREKREGVYLLVEETFSPSPPPSPQRERGTATARIFTLDTNEGKITPAANGVKIPERSHKEIEVILREAKFPIIDEEDRVAFARRKTRFEEKPALNVDKKIPVLKRTRLGFSYPTKVEVLEDATAIAKALYPLLGQPFLPVEESLFAQVLNGREGEKMTFLSPTGAILEIWMEVRSRKSGRYTMSEEENPVHRVAGRLIVPDPDGSGKYFTLPALMHPNRMGTTRLELIVGPDEFAIDFEQVETTLTISGRPAFGFYAVPRGMESREAQQESVERIREWVEYNKLDAAEGTPSVVGIENSDAGKNLILSSGTRINLTVMGAEAERFGLDLFSQRLDRADWPKNPVVRFMKPDGTEGVLKILWPDHTRPLFILEGAKGSRLPLLFTAPDKAVILLPVDLLSYEIGEEIALADGRQFKLKVEKRGDGSFDLAGYSIDKDGKEATVSYRDASGHRGKMTLHRAPGGGSLFYLVSTPPDLPLQRGGDQPETILTLVVLDNGRPLLLTRPEGIEHFLAAKDSRDVPMIGTLDQAYGPEITSTAIRYRRSPEDSLSTLFEVHTVFGRWKGATDSALRYVGKKASAKFRVVKEEDGRVSVLPEGLIKPEGAGEEYRKAHVEMMPSFNGKVRIYIRDAGDSGAYGWMEFESFDHVAGDDKNFAVGLAHFNQRNRKLNLLPSEEGFLEIALRHAPIDADLVERLRDGIGANDLAALAACEGRAGEYAIFQGLLDAAGYREGGTYWAQAFRAMLAIAHEVKRVKGDVGAPLAAPESQQTEVGAGLAPPELDDPHPLPDPLPSRERGEEDNVVPPAGGTPRDDSTTSAASPMVRQAHHVQEAEAARKRREEAEELGRIMAELETIVPAIVRDNKPASSVVQRDYRELLGKVAAHPSGLLKEAREVLSSARAVRDFVPKVVDKNVPKGKEWIDRSPSQDIKRVLMVVYDLLAARLKMKKRGTLTREEFVDAMMKAHVSFGGSGSTVMQLRAAVSGLLKWNRELVDEDLIFFATMNFREPGAVGAAKPVRKGAGATTTKGKGRVDEEGDGDDDGDDDSEPTPAKRSTRRAAVASPAKKKGGPKGTRASGENLELEGRNRSDPITFGGAHVSAATMIDRSTPIVFGNLALSESPPHPSAFGSRPLPQGERGINHLQAKLTSLAQSRGFPDVATFLSRLSQDQLLKLVKVSTEWRALLKRRGYGTVAEEIRETLLATDRVFLTAAALARSDGEVRRIAAHGATCQTGQATFPHIAVPVPVLSGAPNSVLNVLR